MLDALKSLFARLSEAEEHAQFDDNDKRLAAAALLVHTMEVDGIKREVERVKLREVLKATFELNEAELEELIIEARNADYEAVDLYSFTTVLKRFMSEEERAHVIEMMWDISYSDGEVHELEDNIVWRVAELLGISSRDRMILKKKAETAHLKETGEVQEDKG